VNVVVTQQVNYSGKSATIVHSLADAIEVASSSGETEAIIIGGAEIYKQALETNVASKMYLTRVHGVFDGDCFLPEIEWRHWVQTTDPIFHPKDEQNPYGYTIFIFERIK